MTTERILLSNLPLIRNVLRQWDSAETRELIEKLNGADDAGGERNRARARRFQFIQAHEGTEETELARMLKREGLYSPNTTLPDIRIAIRKARGAADIVSCGTKLRTPAKGENLAQ